MEKKDSYIFLDKDTAFQGEVITDHLILEGVIEGEIRASSEVFLKKGAIVQGGIATPRYLVEEGSAHYGRLTMGDQKKNGSVKEALEKAMSELETSVVEEPAPATENGSESNEMVKKNPSSERLW